MRTGSRSPRPQARSGVSNGLYNLTDFPVRPRLETVLEVARYDPATRESVVASAYGTAADWYRNITVEPAQRVRTGRMDYVPEQRFLTAAEAREAAIEFCRRHKLEARLAPRALTAIGAVQEGAFTDPVELLASLPMVGFCPKE